jgi:hypothetical protein
MPPQLPQNSLGLKEWFSYAEWLATHLADIGHTPTERHYARLAFPELQSLNTLDLRFPALLADTPEAEGVDNSSNNLLTRRYLAWTIVKPVEAGNWDAVVDAEDECERIALQVLARLRKDRIHRNGQVFADVDMNGWQGDTVSVFAGIGYAAYRIMVPVLNAERRLVYDAAKWIGDDGPPLLVDVSGLSCTNLNHPTLGLTTQQRLTCILGGYDFSDAATLAALTVQQRADLEDEFGGSGSGGVCPPTTVNGVESAVRAITVIDSNDNPTGTLDPLTGVVTTPACPPVNTLCGLITQATSQEVAVCVTSSGKRPGVLAELIPTVDEGDTVAQVFDVMTAGQKALFDVTVQLRDSGANNLGAPDVYSPGTTTTKTAPDGSVQRKDSAGTNIGTPIAVRSGQTGVEVTCPDATVRSAASTPLYTAAVLSNGTLTLAPVRITKGDGSTEDVEYRPNSTSSVYVERNDLYFDFRASDALSAELMVPTGYAGTYSTLTTDGGSGSVVLQRFSGGVWGTLLVNTIAVGDLIRAQRTISTSAGWANFRTA